MKMYAHLILKTLLLDRSSLRELDVVKKDTGSKLIKAPGSPGLDFIIQNRLNKLKESSSRNNLPPPPSPPPPSFFQPPPPPPPLSSPFRGAERYVPPPQLPQPPTSNFNLPPPTPFPPTHHLFGSHVLTK